MPVIILKLDDFKEPTEAWEAVMDYGIRHNIKLSIGIIGKYLESGDQKTFDWIKSFNNTGNFEFWNHGYHHQKNEKGLEFRGQSADDQYSSLVKTQASAKEKLGITFSTFGAPWNKTDINTIKALEKIPEITVWLHGDVRCRSKICLRPSGMCCEYLKDGDKFFVDFEKFKAEYHKIRTQEYSILQFHPTSWKKMKAVREFFSIVNYLHEQPNTRFMFPNQFATYKYDKQM